EVRLAGGQRDREARALTGLGVDLEAAVHALDELAADVEPQAAAAHAAGLLRVEAVELLEDPLALGARDPQPLVRDLDEALAVLRVEPNLDLAALRRVLDRVVDQIDEHLPQLVLVAEDRAPAAGDELERDLLREMKLRGADHARRE